jgi:hypothetical protein
MPVSELRLLRQSMPIPATFYIVLIDDGKFSSFLA